MSSQNGVSSLIVASFKGHVEVVDKLLQQGATVDLQAKVCVMPLTHKNKCFKRKYLATQKEALYFPNYKSCTLSRNLLENFHMRFIMWMLRKQGITIHDECTCM